MKIGEKIQDISFSYFKDGDIKSSSLSSFLGKWLVVFFYPADFTFICPTELEELANKYKEFTSEDCEVLSVSRDSPFVHMAWHESDKRISKINYPMGSDIKGELTRYFDVFENEDELSLRATFIINPEGVLLSKEVNSNDIGRSIPEILRKLQAAKFVANNSGEVCPVNWEKNKESLKLPEITILK